MINNRIGYTFVFCSFMAASLSAQDAVTNAFEDLQRTGVVKEEASEMRQAASSEQMKALLKEKPASGFFCFTEDRMHDIRLENAIPARWAGRDIQSRNSFRGKTQPGEYYTWQIGIFAPFHAVEGIQIECSDLKNERGDKIKAASLECLNLGGTDKTGKKFRKQVNVEKGNVQALWMGTDIPSSAQGTYTGKVYVKDRAGNTETIDVALIVEGNVLADHGDNEGWRKTRLRWLNSTIGVADTPTAPYTALRQKENVLTWLGGDVELAATGLPSAITTRYDANNQLSSVENPILANAMTFVIETADGVESLKGGKVRITEKSAVNISWVSKQQSRNFEVSCTGSLGYDGIANMSIQVKAKREVSVKDIRLEIPYTTYASTYMMGLGHKGGYRPDSLMTWKWDVNRHQDKIWMGNVNAGLNIRMMDDNFVRPLVNIYYSLGKLNMPKSWGNDGRGGVDIYPSKAGETRMIAYSGERTLAKDEVQFYNFDMQITPVKPIDLKKHVVNRFYHSNSDLSSTYIAEAKKNGATAVNIHHKKEIYPFINYPYYDESLPDLKRFIDEAHSDSLGVRLYYTTRELTVKIPELWALRSLGSEVIHDGPGKDTRTLIHPNGPNEWLNKNLTTHFIPAWYNAFNEGKYAGDMDISVITTPDSRWNNYYLAGLDWMVDKLGIDGVYIDDSALDRETIRRARRILDKDGKERLIDIHSWNHMNQWAGYANSLHLYTELLPYVDRTWIGEGFTENNSLDFWLVEMSGIPFGLLSETLDARNQYRGLVFGMLPRLPWSGNPVPLWNLWDQFGMKDAKMFGYWDKNSPVKTDNASLPATVYVNGKKAMIVIANWTDMPQQAKITIDETALGFKPTKFSEPEIRNLQWGRKISGLNHCEIMGRGGMVVLLEE